MARLDGLTRRIRLVRTSGAARCTQGCFEVDRYSPGWARRLAREHTRQTGHDTQAVHMNVIEYRRAE